MVLFVPVCHGGTPKVKKAGLMILLKKLLLSLAVAVASLGLVAPAMAATTISTDPLGTAPSGTVVCDGVTNCAGALSGTFTNFTTSLDGQWAALPGNSTSQIAVLAGNTAVLTLNQLISGFSLDWGSIDAYNYIDVFYAGGMQTFSGALIPPANGNQSLPATNQRVNFAFNGPLNVSSIAFRSTQNSFEFDNVAINSAVPEPGTWAMMIFGFAAIGGAMRRRTNRRISFA